MSDLDNIQAFLTADQMEVNGGTPSQSETVYYQPIVGAATALCTVHVDVNARWVIYDVNGKFLETGYGSVGLSSAMHRWGLPTKAVVSQLARGL